MSSGLDTGTNGGSAARSSGDPHRAGRPAAGQFLGQVERQRLERARFAQHRRRARRRDRAARGNLGHIAQFLQGFGKDHPGPRHHRAHQLVIAGHRAGVGRGGFARGAGLAGMQQHHRLARSMGAPRCRQKALRLAELLHDHGNGVGIGIVDQPIDEVFHAARRLVAGGHRIGNAAFRASSMVPSTAAIAPDCETIPTARLPAGGTALVSTKVSGMRST
jgi:hypothetical protein